MGDSRIACKALRERIQHPDQLRITTSENIESTFIWKIEKFQDLKNSLLGIPIKTELGSLKNNSDSKVTSELECKSDDIRNALGNSKYYILKVAITILSSNDIMKLVIHSYIVGNNVEKCLNTVELLKIPANKEVNVNFYDNRNIDVDYKLYLENGTMTLAFLITELKFFSK